MDLIERQKAIDALADMHCKSDEDGYVWIIRSDAWARIDALPSAQSEYRLDEWCTDCKEYDKERHCCPRWNKVIRETLKDAQPEQRWIPCGKCIHADGKHRRCKILDRSINEDYFCCWAEPYREEGDE